MPEQEIESSPIISDWGVADWRDASAYPDETLPLVLWQWEFLRRREDYRQDWRKYAPETYAQDKADYDANPVHQHILGYKPDTHEPVIEESPKVLVHFTDMNFQAKMSGSQEKYGLSFLHHPANPCLG